MENLHAIESLISIIRYLFVYWIIGGVLIYVQALRWAYREGNKRAVGGEFGFFMVFFFGLLGIFYILLSEKLYD